MSASMLIARAVLRLVPPDRADWGCAMASEIVHAGRATPGFALGCLAAAATMRVRHWSTRGMTMALLGMEHPRRMALAAGVIASMLGLVYLTAAGAPAGLVAANAAAIVLGLAGFAAARGGEGTPPRLGLLVPATALALLGTAALGLSADGAARWLRVAGVAIQPSLVLLPLATMVHLIRRDRLTTAAMALTAAALAWQPDRAMAGVLLLSLAAGGRRSGAIPLASAAAAFVVTLVRPDVLPATPFVDGILFSAPRAGWVQGVAVIGGTIVALLPTLVAIRDPRAETRAFGACWLGVVAAAALGNYPTPLVGYGGSAILGYLLAAAALPARLAHRAAPAAATTDTPSGRRLFRLA